MPALLPNILLAASPVSAFLILILCVLAGIGTLLLLPGPRERSIRNIGAALLLAVFLVFIAVLVRQQAIQGATQLYFWLFSAIAIISAVRVISHEKPVYAALYFVLTVVATAGLFVLLWAEFMAAALILIYAGAILVTYVFVIMLAQQVERVGSVTIGAEYDRFSREPVLASAVGFTLMGLILFLIFDKSPALPPPAQAPVGGSAQQVGQYLFTNQVISLELAGLILTLAMIGAVVIARRKVPELTPAEPSAPAPLLHDDNPHTIPVYGTDNPKAKAYPEQ